MPVTAETVCANSSAGPPFAPDFALGVEMEEGVALRAL